jgi:hypothetical protein
MRRCGIPEIDNENKALTKEAKRVILKNEVAKDILQKINDFRMKLAYNKATESLESNFGWTKTYEELIKSLSKNTKI